MSCPLHPPSAPGRYGGQLHESTARSSTWTTRSSLPASAAPIPIIILLSSYVSHAFVLSGLLVRWRLGISNSPPFRRRHPAGSRTKACRSGRDDTRRPSHAIRYGAGLADSMDSALSCIAPADCRTTTSFPSSASITGTALTAPPMTSPSSSPLLELRLWLHGIQTSSRVHPTMTRPSSA